MTAGPARSPEERQRLLIGLCLAAHDGDDRGFKALLSGIPRPELVVVIHLLAEVVVSGQLAMEDSPGAARAGLAREALNAAGR